MMRILCTLETRAMTSNTAQDGYPFAHVGAVPTRIGRRAMREVPNIPSIAQKYWGTERMDEWQGKDPELGTAPVHALHLLCRLLGR